jgi:hypothetical protein
MLFHSSHENIKPHFLAKLVQNNNFYTYLYINAFFIQKLKKCRFNIRNFFHVINLFINNMSIKPHTTKCIKKTKHVECLNDDNETAISSSSHNIVQQNKFAENNAVMLYHIKNNYGFCDEYKNSIDTMALVAQSYMAKSKMSYRFKFFNVDNNYYNMFNHNENLFECFPTNKPHRPYFDLEIERDGIGKSECNNIICVFKVELVKMFKLAFDIKLKVKDICILDCCRENKLSYHAIVVNDTYFKSNIDQLTFIKYFIDNTKDIEIFQWCKVIKSGELEKRHIIDPCVYKSNQNFRCVNQSKYGSKSILKIITKHTVKDTFIRIFDVDNMLMLNVEPFLDKIKIEKISDKRNDNNNNVNVLNINEKMFCTKGKTLYDTIKRDKLATLPLYKKYLCLIPAQHNRDIWLSIGFALKTCGTKEDWIEFSKLGDKYVDGECDVWSGFRLENCYTELTLKKYAMLANPDILNSVVPNYKLYDRITFPYDEHYEYVEINCKYLSDEFNYGSFLNNNIIIVQSDCGTGKTFCTMKYCKKYLKYCNGFKFISVVNRITLADQHMSTAEEVGFDLTSYKDSKVGKTYGNIVVCVNSLMMLQHIALSEDKFTNHIVYFDEISTFLESITHNCTLDNHMQLIEVILSCIFATAYKIICTDALINDNIFLKLQRLRKFDCDCLFVNNTFKKFQGVKAIQHTDEKEFRECVIDEVVNVKRGFFFMSDSKTVVDEMYIECINKAKTKAERNKFVKFTSESKPDIKCAKSELDGKYVFCSPTVTTGLDGSFEFKQNVYQYIKGDSIMSNNIYQQTTRTRLIDEVHYFSCAIPHDAKYANLDQCIEINSKIVADNMNLLNVEIGISGEMQVVRNNHFYQYCYNEYIKDIYKTNVLKHYELILESQGFCLVKLTGDVSKMKTVDKKNVKVLLDDEKGEVFDLYVKELKELEEEDREVVSITCEKMHARAKYLGITTDNIILYQKYIESNNTFSKHLATRILFYSDKQLNKKINDMTDNMFDIEFIKSTVAKVKIIRKLENDCKISFMDVNFDNSPKVKVKLSKKDHNIMVKMFRKRGENKIPETVYELKLFYVGLVRSIGENFIDVINVNQNESKICKYKISKDRLIKIKKLIFLSNKNKPPKNAYSTYLRILS